MEIENKIEKDEDKIIPVTPIKNKLSEEEKSQIVKTETNKIS